MPKHGLKLTKEEMDLECAALAGADVPASEDRKEELRKMALTTLDERKKPVNIRMDPADIIMLRQKAEESGLGYQTFMASVLHRFVTGNLVDRHVVDEIRMTFSKMMSEKTKPDASKSRAAETLQKKRTGKQRLRHG